jgi:hypothetical protein
MEKRNGNMAAPGIRYDARIFVEQVEDANVIAIGGPLKGRAAQRLRESSRARAIETKSRLA